MKIFKISIALMSGLFLTFSPIAFAKVTGNTITLGSAISFTGKYSSNGIHASNGYNLGIKRVNEMGGVREGGNHQNHWFSNGFSSFLRVQGA